MKQYSFLLSESITQHLIHPVKDSYKAGKNKYFINRGDFLNNKKDNIVQFIGKLISAPSFEMAISILKKEKMKLNWSKIPKDVLKHIELILMNCDEDNYIEKLTIYRDSFLL